MAKDENEIEFLIKDAAEAILKSKNIIALTGAGISVESGIPPFRGKKGLWERYDPEEYAYVDAFIRDPEKVWQMLKELLDTILSSKPNSAHFALVELEEMGFLEGIITQNVDSLHQAAGSKIVVELHGNNRNLICMKCRNTCPIELYQKTMPPKCECGSILRPDVVLFGEQIPKEALFESYRMSMACDLIMVIGTSAIVSPASEMPIVAKEGGAKVMEINTEETFLTSYVSDWMIRGQAGDTLPKIVSELKNLEKK
jgi:NAD-dependent deacetylase